jgi:hypothetical protein
LSSIGDFQIATVNAAEESTVLFHSSSSEASENKRRKPPDSDRIRYAGSCRRPQKRGGQAASTDGHSE